MKKLTALLLALIMCLSFAACGDEGGINEDSAKFIPGGAKLGMNADQIKEVREADDAFVREDSITGQKYGHTVLNDFVSYEVFNDYIGMDYGFDQIQVLYHMDKNLYSVEVRLFTKSQRMTEDIFDRLTKKYVDLLGEDYEVEEYSTYGKIAEWKGDAVNVKIDMWQGSTQRVYIYITSPGRDHPEWQ